MAIEIFQLPVGNEDPDQTTTFSLDSGGKRYDIRVKYNQRLGNVATSRTTYDAWKLYISLTGQEPFIETPLKTSRDLLASHRYKTDCPKGVLVLSDTAALLATSDPAYNYSPERVTFEELGTRFQLTYIENNT